MAVSVLTLCQTPHIPEGTSLLSAMFIPFLSAAIFLSLPRLPFICLGLAFPVLTYENPILFQESFESPDR